MTTLLQAAKKVPKKQREIDDQAVELAIFWLAGDVTTAQVTAALKYRPGGQQAYTTLARALKEAYNQHKIKMV